jgi:3-dehydroquinate synthetase
MEKDKKRNGSRIHVVLLRGIGRAVVEETPIHKLGDAIGAAL